MPTPSRLTDHQPPESRPIQQRKTQSLPQHVESFVAGADRHVATGKEPMEVDGEAESRGGVDAREASTAPSHDVTSWGGDDMCGSWRSDKGERPVRVQGAGVFACEAAAPSSQDWRGDGRTGVNGGAELTASGHAAEAYAPKSPHKLTMRRDEVPRPNAELPAHLAAQPQSAVNKWAKVRSNLGQATLNAAEAQSGGSSPKKSGSMLKSMADVVIAAHSAEKDKKLASHEAQDQNAEQVPVSFPCHPRHPRLPVSPPRPPRVIPASSRHR